MRWCLDPYTPLAPLIVLTNQPTTRHDHPQRPNTRTHTELPALARFLVVAAYLASHVAPDTDLFLFAAGSAKSGPGKKRSAKQAVRQERQAEVRVCVEGGLGLCAMGRRPI